MREKIYRVIEVAGDNDRVSSFYDIFMMVTIIISLIPLTTKSQGIVFDCIDIISVIVFITITWVAEDKSNIKLEVKDVPKYEPIWMPSCYGTLERIETY
jgi:hypothetical protein